MKGIYEFLNNYINMNFFSKELTKKIFYNQTIMFSIIILFGTILTYKTISPLQCLFIIIIYYLYIYIS